MTSLLFRTEWFYFLVTLLLILPASNASADEPQSRTWQDGTGKFSIDAMFVVLRDGKVHLRKSGGEIVKVPLEKLSKEDQEYVGDLKSESSEPPVNQEVEKYDDGTTKAIYTILKDGTRHGVFREFHADGKLKSKGSYLDGKLSGEYVEMDKNGDTVVAANYRLGQLNGFRQRRSGRELKAEEFWIDGQLIIPKSSSLLKKELAAIAKVSITTDGENPKVNAEVAKRVGDKNAQQHRENALRTLMMYRCVVHVTVRISLSV
ncbi:MAG: SHD1 domain-containing protein [Planctomycetales bacterium]